MWVKGDQDADTIFRTKRLSKNGIPSIVVRYHNETIFFLFLHTERERVMLTRICNCVKILI